MLRYTITFTGSVQGVGFRYTTVRVAQRFAVAGWVRNEDDGSVLCVAEGEADELDRFIEAVKQAMQGNIRETHVKSSEARGEFTAFDIQR